MPTTLIISAHPGDDSFTASWAKASRAAAQALGHEVLWSDLNAMGFDAVERPQHYGRDASGFDPLKAQEEAARAELPQDVAREVAKLLQADRVIFHFPLWWFAPPAILKGWCDRVLVHGLVHDVDNRFDAGRCTGKTALFCVSTGASAAEVGPDGKEGRLEYLLWPLAYTLRYCGFDIADPEAVHGVHGYWTGTDEADLQNRLAATLARQQDLLRGLPDRPRWRFNADTDFDAAGRLNPDAPRHWPFIGG